MPATAGANFTTRPTAGFSNFRLLETTRLWSFSPATNSADPTTDAGGAITKVTWGPTGISGFNFTLGNAALGISNQVLPLTTVVVGGRDVRQATLADGRVLTVYVDTMFDSTTDFAWTAYGNWNIVSSGGVVQNGAAFVTGFETASASVPTSGSATFNGFVEGSAFVPNGANLQAASLRGNAQLNVGWTSGAITGTASSIVATPVGTTTTQAWNGLTFAGNITAGTSRFSGTTTATGTPGTGFAVTAGAAGTINGQFYGTSAQEVGAIWNVRDGTNGAFGYLVAKQ